MQGFHTDYLNWQTILSVSSVFVLDPLGLYKHQLPVAKCISIFSADFLGSIEIFLLKLLFFYEVLLAFLMISAL